MKARAAFTWFLIGVTYHIAFWLGYFSNYKTATGVFPCLVFGIILAFAAGVAILFGLTFTSLEIFDDE